MAAFGIVLDRATTSLHSINFGAPLPQICDLGGFTQPLEPTTGSSPLGWYPETPVTTFTAMAPGHLLIWTDGLPDLARQHDVDPLAFAHRSCGRMYPTISTSPTPLPILP
ncbi:MAG: hypothetical protein J6386_20150 [Candidatus Synoicihabitans palmerolidicus]|nr:hypothetical protein [Candidatus Synoicihabitans palmerolidicus]